MLHYVLNDKAENSLITSSLYRFFISAHDFSDSDFFFPFLYRIDDILFWTEFIHCI